LEDVFPLLLSRHPELRYIIAGNGPELSSIRRVVAARGLQRSVDVLGPVPDRHKETLLSEASLLLMPNIPVFGDMEGFGITAIEAAARGLPVVAADLEGLRDSVIDGVTGLRFQSLDLQSAAIAVESALSRSWDTQSMQRAIRDCFAADVIASRYVHELF
jgi:glycosyltransferase involved in cell wall biosynthesis